MPSFVGLSPRFDREGQCAPCASQILLRSVFFHRVARKFGFFLKDKQQFLKYPDKEIEFISKKHS